jgi:pimeloyl-ACP methyl ester carboxylesterase
MKIMNTQTNTIPDEVNKTESRETGNGLRCWLRLWRGIACWLTFFIAPFGWFCSGRLIRRMEPERLDKGLVLLLTGIEGRSFLNVGLLAGMIDGGVRSAVEIVDWTTGNKLLFLLHLRGWNRNNRVAMQLAARIVEYQDRFPSRPVWMVGHSGGGGMALLTAAALPEDRKVTGIVMLATGVSPRFDLRPAAAKVETAIWNYHSWFDCFFLIFGTTIMGTIDGRHGPAAGAGGFRNPQAAELSAAGRLIQVPWNWRMLGQFNPGEHFGCVHRVFVAEEIAPLVVKHESE